MTSISPTSLSVLINQFVELKSCVLNGKCEDLQNLLQNSEYLDLINEPDSLEDNKTLLHLASAPERRDAKIIKILLGHGADPAQADNQDKLPLHYIVSEGTGCFCNNCTTRAEECTLILLEANSTEEVVNKKCNENFKTPLYYAADSRLSNCAILLLKYGADINICPNPADDLASLLLKQIPEVFETILDQSIQMDTGNNARGHLGRKLKIDFGLFLGQPNTCQRAHSVTDLEVPRREGDFLHRVLSLSKHEGRDKILSHPVTEIFMYKKNSALQIAFLVPQLFRFALAIVYTFFVFGFFLYNCPYYHDDSSQDVNQTLSQFITNMTNVKSVRIPLTPYVISVQIEGRNFWPNHTTTTENGIENCHPWSVIKVLAGIVTFLSGMMFIYLVIKLFLKPKYSTKSSSFWLWALYVIFSTITLIPVFFGTASDGIDSFYYPTAAIATFLVWSMLLGELARIPSVGVHLEMLNKVIMTVLFCIFAYGLLVLAFAFGFHIMFPKNELFSSPYLSFVKVLMIMVGDTDYDGIFKEKNVEGSNEDLLYWIPAHLFYAAFLILITIVFMNLLVGLAVSDIQKLKQKAKIAKAIGFIELLNLVELNLFTSIWDSPYLRWTSGVLNFLKRKLSVVSENSRGEIQWYIEIPASLNERKNSTSILPALFRTDLLPEKLCRKILDRYKSACNC